MSLNVNAKLKVDAAGCKSRQPSLGNSPHYIRKVSPNFAINLTLILFFNCLTQIYCLFPLTSTRCKAWKTGPNYAKSRRLPCTIARRQPPVMRVRPDVRAKRFTASRRQSFTFSGIHYPPNKARVHSPDLRLNIFVWLQHLRY